VSWHVASLQTDRVVLTPGPLEEIDRVQTIYSMIVEEGTLGSAVQM
jgi:hypothetical protein